MNELKEKYYIALGNLQNMAIDNTKGSKSVDICVLDINEYVAYLQSKIDRAIEYINTWIVDKYSICIPDKDYPDIACVYEPKAIDKLLDILKEDK